VNPFRFFCCEKGDKLRDIAWFAERGNLPTPSRVKKILGILNAFLCGGVSLDRARLDQVDVNAVPESSLGN